MPPHDGSANQVDEGRCCIGKRVKRLQMAKAKAVLDIRSLARSHTETCIRALAKVVANTTSDAARVAAASELLDRGWGKSAQSLTGADGEGAISITIRHIVEEIRRGENDRKLLAPPGE